jgi:hypothetical protein
MRRRIYHFTIYSLDCQKYTIHKTSIEAISNELNYKKIEIYSKANKKAISYDLNYYNKSFLKELVKDN